MGIASLEAYFKDSHVVFSASEFFRNLNNAMLMSCRLGWLKEDGPFYFALEIQGWAKRNGTNLRAIRPDLFLKEEGRLDGPRPQETRNEPLSLSLSPHTYRVVQKKRH